MLQLPLQHPLVYLYTIVRICKTYRTEDKTCLGVEEEDQMHPVSMTSIMALEVRYAFFFESQVIPVLL